MSDEIFDTDDVIKLARAVLEYSSGYGIWLGSCKGYEDGCVFCEALDRYNEPHALDCPSIIAKDLLTGFDTGGENV